MVAPNFLGQPGNLSNIFLCEDLRHRIVIICTATIDGIFRICISHRLVLFCVRINIVYDIRLCLRCMVETDRCPDPIIFDRRQISTYFTQQAVVLEARSHSVLVVRFGRTRNIPTTHAGFSQQEITFPRTEIDTFLSTHAVLLRHGRIVIVFSSQFGSQTTFHIPFTGHPCPPSISRIDCQHRLRVIIRIEQGDRFHLAGRPDIIGINHTIVPSYYTK